MKFKRTSREVLRNMEDERVKFSKLKGRVKKLMAMVLTASMVLSTDVVAGATSLSDIISDEVMDENEFFEDELTGLEADIEDAEYDVTDTETAVEDKAQNTERTLSENGTGSGNYIPEMATNALLAPAGVKATITVKNYVRLSWKKVKKAKYYGVYRLKADGTCEQNYIYYDKKTSFLDKAACTSEAQTYAYKIVAFGVDMYGQEGHGEASYVIATPIITDIERGMDDPDAKEMDIKYTTVKGASSYSIERSLIKKKDGFSSIPNLTNVPNAEGNKFDPYTGGGFLSAVEGATFKQERATDNGNGDGLSELTYYYYRVKAKFNVAGYGEIESAYSKVQRGRITTRAPYIYSVSANTATTLYLEWEDLENAIDKEGNKIISSTDYYQIYYKAKGSKWATVKIKASKTDQVKHEKAKKVYLTEEEAKEQGVGTTAGEYFVDVINVCYELEGVKPCTNYSVRIAAIKNKIVGNKSEIHTVYTDLNDIKDLKVKGTDLTSATLTWTEIEGATSYNVYYTPEISEAKRNDLNSVRVENGQQYYGPISVKPVYDEDVAEKDKNKNGDKICIYTKTGLTNLKNYAFYVEPVYKKNAHDSGKNRMYVTCQTRIAAPKVTIKQSGSTLKLSWEKVSNATGYKIQCVKGTNVITQADIAEAEFYSKGKVSYDISGLEYGMPVAIKITTMHATGGLTNSDPDAQGNAYREVEYLCPTVPEVTDALYNGQNKGAYLKLKYKTTVIQNKYNRGYQVWRSTKKSKDYELVGETSSFNEPTNFGDEQYLQEGKKVYYRVYAIVQGSTDGNKSWKAVSRDYVQTVFCNPTSAKETTISVEVDKTKEHTVSFTPSGTTMKQFTSWYVSDTASPKSESFAEHATKNKYVSITTKDYSNTTADYYSPTIKIKGLKKGTTCVQGTMVNGMTVVFTVKVTEKTNDDDDDDDPKKEDVGTVICLDPGHGGSDGGCVYGNYKEKDINLEISKKTKEILKKDYGFKNVVLTRSTDKAVDLDVRVKTAKDAKAKAIIAQHINSGSGKGVECYYSIDGTGKSLATKMCAKTSDATGMKNRGAKTRESNTNAGQDYYAIIRYARSKSDGGAITGVIMENGFIQGDLGYMDSDADLEKIAKANASAIASVYGD